MIKELIAKIPKPLQYLIAAGLAIILLLVLWFYGTKAWNGVGAFFFDKKVEKLQSEIDKKDAIIQAKQKEIDKTLLELKMSKEELAAAGKAREEAEKVFNDKSKTAAEKVAAFQRAMSAAPDVADPNVSINELCERAKTSGASPAVISALCS